MTSEMDPNKYGDAIKKIVALAEYFKNSEDYWGWFGDFLFRANITFNVLEQNTKAILGFEDERMAEMRKQLNLEDNFMVGHIIYRLSDGLEVDEREEIPAIDVTGWRRGQIKSNNKDYLSLEEWRGLWEEKFPEIPTLQDLWPDAEKSLQLHFS